MRQALTTAASTIVHAVANGLGSILRPGIPAIFYVTIGMMGGTLISAAAAQVASAVSGSGVVELPMLTTRDIVTAGGFASGLVGLYVAIAKDLAVLRTDVGWLKDTVKRLEGK